LSALSLLYAFLTLGVDSAVGWYTASSINGTSVNDCFLCRTSQRNPHDASLSPLTWDLHFQDSVRAIVTKIQRPATTRQEA